MRKFIINVNGNSYEVEVEEVKNGVVPQPVRREETRPAPAPISKPAPQKPSGGAAGSVKVLAPMPGNIMSVNVNQGDKVKKGQVLCILEAMKMENEIMAPRDGVVSSVNVAKGASVNSGDLLVSLN